MEFYAAMKKNEMLSFASIILASREEETRRIMVHGQPWTKS
jgi:hypothetical protein